jgi:hypothetical protein
MPRLSPRLERAFRKARRFARTPRRPLTQDYLSMVRAQQDHPDNRDGADKTWVLEVLRRQEKLLATARWESG